MVYFVFQKYGKIADVRINLGKSKVGGGPKGAWTPNFGFVTFAEEGAVGKVGELFLLFFFYLY